jgi:hypothetical protein
MTEHTPAPARRIEAPEAARRPSGHPGGISIERVTALVDCASGADAAAIEGLEAIVANLRRARDARTELAATVPPELLRQVLIARASRTWHPEQPGHTGQPTPDETPVRPEGRA